MTRAKFSESASSVKLLSLLLAGLLWLCVILERTDELTLQVPIHPEYLPAGLRLCAPLPEKLAVTFSGPRILLCRLPFGGLSCQLDLSAAVAGSADFVPRAGSLGMDRELKVVGIKPASLNLTLAKQTSTEKDKRSR